LVLAIASLVLLANYLATYIVFVASLVTLALIVPLEERELRTRFGSAYDDYAARVPSFIPKWSRG
jgi:protein-S-isoprenylcysteine O-methyltransferase Ste14